MVKLNKKKKAELTDFLKNRFREIYDKKQCVDERVVQWQKQYNSIPDDDKEDFQTNMFIPYTFSQIAGLKPRMRFSLFTGKDPFLSVRAKSKNFKDSEIGIRDMLMHEFESIDFPRVMKDAMHSTLPNGTGWVKVTMDKDNNLKMTELDFFDVIVDFTQEGQKSNDFHDIFHRIETTPSAMMLKQAQGVYEDVEEVASTSFPCDEIVNNQLRSQSYYLSIAELGIDEKRYKQKNFNKVELLEWWGWYDIEGKGVEIPIVATLANREKLIRVDVNKDMVIPIFPLRCYRIPRLVYGKSICQMVEGLQYEMNEKRNQRMDALNLILKPWLKARRSADIDWDNLYQTPDNIIRMDDPQTDLIPAEIGRIPGAVYQEDPQMKSDMQFAVGINDIGFSAQGRGAATTATGISITTSEGATRFRDYLDDFSLDIIEIVKYILFLIKKYKNMERQVRLYDSHEWRNITAQEIKQDYAISVDLATLIQNKEMRIQLLINLVNVLGNSPKYDVDPLIREILALAEIPNKEDVTGDKREKLKQEIKEEAQKAVQAKLQPAFASPLQGQDIGLDRPINEILQNTGASRVLNPSAPQTVQNPLASLFRNIGGAPVA